MKPGCAALALFLFACSKQPWFADSSAAESARVGEVNLGQKGSSGHVAVASEDGLPATSTTAAGTDTRADAETDGAPTLRLPRFYGALSRLEAGERQAPVRIAWFGDSHTAADFLTGELRGQLQERYGNAGPGFVHVGIDSTRHDEVSSSASGRWQRQPASPAAFYEQDDAVFGLAGMRAHVREGTALLRPRAEPGHVNWEFVVRPTSATARLALAAPGVNSTRVDFPSKVTGDALVQRRGSQLFGVTYRTDASAELHVQARSLDVFGAFGESDASGVVLDVMGINGARIRTMLAWHEGVWLGELAERAPDLVVLAYGTNEAGDGNPITRYEEDYRRVMERVAAAAPEADCLLVGPTARGSGQERQVHRTLQLDELQARVAHELGCAYFSLFEAMGGAGSYERWAGAEPRLASSDGVHLTQEGYRRLGRLLAGRLLASQRAYAW